LHHGLGKVAVGVEGAGVGRVQQAQVEVEVVDPQEGDKEVER
jgi:hypothetical protein